jgi:methyltransferase (TIGR00027 family)
VVTSEAHVGTTQLVLLGAGFDARAWRLESLAGTTVFEVDHPDTQRGKRAAIGSRAPVAREIRYAPIDFAHESVDEVLARAGHDPSTRTTFVWEGVTMYLPSAAIDATLAAISRVAAPGSCIAATYHDVEWGWESAPLTFLVRVVGEPFQTRMSRDDVRRRVESHGFVIEADEGSDDWSRRYLRQRGYRDGERLFVARRRSERS